MNLKIVAVDKLRNRSFRDLTDDYLGRLEHYASVEVIELKSASRRARDPKEIKRLEADEILAAVDGDLLVVAMDEQGKAQTSRELASWLNDQMISGVKGATFIIGGAYGLDRSVRKRAHQTMCLSSMTMPHEMARMFLAEQLYRAMTIVRGEPYHK